MQTADAIALRYLQYHLVLVCGKLLKTHTQGDYESEGRMFESCRVHHFMIAPSTMVSERNISITHYRPDCDFINGELQRRNLEEKDHSNLRRTFGR